MDVSHTAPRFAATPDLAHGAAGRFGTPLYLMCETTFRRRIATFLSQANKWENRSRVSYASKANPLGAILKIAFEEGLDIDVASGGELASAILATVPYAACHVHGNVKTNTDIDRLSQETLGAIVIDNTDELERIVSRFSKIESRFFIRIAPGVNPLTHHKLTTGNQATKFGFSISDGSAEAAVERLRETVGCAGVHLHVGSQLFDPEPHAEAAEVAAAFCAKVGGPIDEINLGGGFGVAYTADHPPLDLPHYLSVVLRRARKALQGYGIDAAIGLEPGRWLVAEAGVTLYTVCAIKTAGDVKFVSVDGGLSDNPRPALYGSRYEVRRVWPGSEEEETERVTVVGKHCEPDVLFSDVELPADLKLGDILEVQCTGAYNLSMASNYNRYPRPACALVRPDGRLDLIQRRETVDDVIGRDVVPPDL